MLAPFIDREGLADSREKKCGDDSDSDDTVVTLDCWLLRE